jgi:acetoin utilization deacetylase AcuC-like enzyme
VRADRARILPSTVLYFSHPACLEHDPDSVMPGHPERPQRLLAIDPDTYAVKASWDAALRSAGGACAMVRALLGGEGAVGFSATRPAGHHAERYRAMGFCLFDNVAVAAELAIRELGVERILVVDWDVHHGNGTAEIFRLRDDVLVANIHQGDIFPGSGPLSDVGSGPGEGYTVNLPVPAGAGEELWLSLLEQIVVPVGLAFEPQRVLISAGFDAHRADPLANCLLEAESFALMACHLRSMAATLDAPLGGVLEGGYDVDALADSVAATLAALGGDREAVSAPLDSMLTSQAAAQIGRYWDL